MQHNNCHRTTRTLGDDETEERDDAQLEAEAGSSAGLSGEPSHREYSSEEAADIVDESKFIKRN